MHARSCASASSTGDVVRFVHLNVHSNYSFCRGASRLEELVVAARRRGMDTMALTDTNGLHGLIWFLEAAKTAGLRPIVGAEIDLRALAQRAEFPVEEPGDPWIAPGPSEGGFSDWPVDHRRDAQHPRLLPARLRAPSGRDARRRASAGSGSPVVAS